MLIIQMYTKKSLTSLSLQMRTGVYFTTYLKKNNNNGMDGERRVFKGPCLIFWEVSYVDNECIYLFIW